MDSRFRKFFLQQMEGLMKEEPSAETLLKLLQMGKSDFSAVDLQNEPARLRAFRVLKSMVHPDKHPTDAHTITPLFQQVQSFYDKCCVVMKRKKKEAPHSPTSVQFPLQFHVKDQWPYLNVVNPTVPSFVFDRGLIARVIAFKCINFRGAIAHGKITEVFYTSEQISEPAFANEKSVKDVFDIQGGGTKALSDIDAIKEELMKRGPVVSTSFRLYQAFLNACQHSSSFAASQINQIHPLVIVGWTLSAFGEMWLVRSIDWFAFDIPIAIGQFGIDDECLAPIGTFEQTPWQDQTKAFDVFMGDVEWYTWTGLETYVDHNELTALTRALGGSFAWLGNTRIIVRDKNKIARSRWAYITNISWSDDFQKWKVAATFLE